MIRNFILVALRNFGRNKFYSAINLTGLSLGLSCSIFILLWIADELKYDSFHKNGPKLYRVLKRDFFGGGQVEVYPQGPGLLVDGLKAEVPEIEMGSQMSWALDEVVTVGTQSNRHTCRYVQPDFLKMFTFPLTKGNADKALDKPLNIVLTEKLANQYFPNEDPIGKLVRINNKREFQVSAVIKDPPRNSSIQFDYLLHWDVFLEINPWAKEWENNAPRAFVMLHDANQRASVDKKIKDFVHKRVSNPKTNISELFLQPYDEWYLYGKFTRGQQDGGRIEYVRSFSIVALVVLVIACINFMNLATAQSLKRAKEIGVRKVTGAPRRILIAQFLGEAVIYALLGLGIAMLIVEISLPTFRVLTDKQIEMPYHDMTFMLALLGIAVITGLLSGMYPAFFLSSFDIVKVLKGTLKFGPGPMFLRKGLVVFQFGLTILLIFSTLVVYRQMQFIKDKNLGFDKENLITVNLNGVQPQKVRLIANESANQSGIKSVTISTTSPLAGGDSSSDVQWPGKSPDNQTPITQMGVGYNYLATMGIELKEGRDFSRDFATDSAAYIVNEEMVRIMNLEKPLGQVITFWGVPGPIIGIVKNYHINSLHVAIEPVILHFHPQWGNLIIARTEGGKTKEALDGLKGATQKINASFPFDYNFADEAFAAQYKGETTVGKLASYFSTMAILISCLGLMGLISFSAEQRTKEIGVRKVLGASVQSIYALFSKDLLVLVVIAIAVASPLGWYIMSNWLAGFAYRTDISAMVFLVSGVVAIGIALITISYQALKAALVNPVKSLRSE